MSETQVSLGLIQDLFLNQMKRVTSRTMEDIYSHEALEELSDDDSISSDEEAFMEGYLKA